MTITREKLYDEVWVEPMLKVALRYKVSSTFLARVCDRLNVPKPPRGYWRKLEFGDAPARPALPEARYGDELEWSRDRWPRTVSHALPKPPPEKKPDRKRPRSYRPARHPLVVGAREHFDAAKVSEAGFLRPWKRVLVDIFVTKDTIGRALDTTSELFLAFEDRGHKVAFSPYGHGLGRPSVDERLQPGGDRFGFGTWSPDRPTVTYVGTVAFGLTLFELTESVEVMNVDGKYVPVDQIPEKKRRRLAASYSWTHKRDTATGRFCLRASSPYRRVEWERQWRESEPGDLMGKIPKIVRALEAEAPEIAKLVAEGERQAEIERKEWEIQQEEWRREQEERQRVENIKASREQLVGVIEAWGAAKRIEDFFDDAERRIAALGEEDRRLLLERLRRARALIGNVDALHRFKQWKSPEER